jgi:hypothetical protein
MKLEDIKVEIKIPTEALKRLDAALEKADAKIPNRLKIIDSQYRVVGLKQLPEGANER